MTQPLQTVAQVDALLAAWPPGPSPPPETVPLDQAAGRVLAVPVRADRDGPPFDRVVLDGWAVGPGPGPWTVVGFSPAGRPPRALTAPDQAVETATGAPLPPGAVAVVPYEDSAGPEGRLTLRPGVPAPAAGQAIHRQGSDYRTGDLLVAPGTRLTPAHLASLAAVGLTQVPVGPRLRWALVTTGDEVAVPPAEPRPWQIRGSHGVVLGAEGAAWGFAPISTAHAPDEAEALDRALGAAAAGAEVVVVTGGVSAGALDLVPGALGALGFEIVVHGVAQRPGKPFLVGRRGSQVVFGLPGNPVSALVAFRRFVVPFLRTREGAPQRPRRVPAPTPLAAEAPDRTLFLPWVEGQGPLPWTNSGDFAALGPSTGFVEVGPDPRSWTEPLYYPWGGSL